MLFVIKKEGDQIDMHKSYWITNTEFKNSKTVNMTKMAHTYTYTRVNWGNAIWRMVQIDATCF
jgi:hypothetical protein